MVGKISNLNIVMHKTKYSRDDRIHLAEIIENLKNNEDCIAVFEILMKDNANCYTHNSNGVFLNLSVVGDKTLTAIKNYLQKINQNGPIHCQTWIDSIPNDHLTAVNRIYKLSNRDKNILKQLNANGLNSINNYTELEFHKSKNKKLI